MFSKYYSGAVACTLAVTCFVSVPVWAKVSAEEASKLGNELTCQGAEKAGNAEGTIPEYSGSGSASLRALLMQGLAHPTPTLMRMKNRFMSSQPATWSSTRPN